MAIAVTPAAISSIEDSDQPASPLIVRAARPSVRGQAGAQHRSAPRSDERRAADPRRIGAAAGLADQADAAAQPDRGAPAAAARRRDRRWRALEISQAVVWPTLSTVFSRGGDFHVAAEDAAPHRGRAGLHPATERRSGPSWATNVRHTPATPMRTWRSAGAEEARRATTRPLVSIGRRRRRFLRAQDARANGRAARRQQLHAQQGQRARRRVAGKIVQAKNPFGGRARRRARWPRRRRSCRRIG